MIVVIIGYILIFIVVIALCRAAARADRKMEDIKKKDDLSDIN